MLWRKDYDLVSPRKPRGPPRRDDGKNGRRKEGRKVEARKGEKAKISKDGRHLS